MASKRRNMFHKNKTQEMTEKGRSARGRDPATGAHGDFWLLGVPPGPVRPSLADLGTPGSPGTSMSMATLARTPTRRGPAAHSHSSPQTVLHTRPPVKSSELLSAVESDRPSVFGLPPPASHRGERKAAVSAETSPGTLANAPEIVPDVPKKEFMPPIVLNGKPANITQFITDTRKVTQYNIRVRLTGRNTKIIIASRGNYHKVYDLYKERNVQFYSFAFKDEHLKRELFTMGWRAGETVRAFGEKVQDVVRRLRARTPIQYPGEKGRMRAELHEELALRREPPSYVGLAVRMKNSTTQDSAIAEDAVRSRRVVETDRAPA
ncbi:hypothetical protein AAG570_002651 [Ranatra chinensis]|uniref:Uncharacterized protein n=1 Tax=Ranatra chinensis TaxID=642074 RepID=A0ABD0Y873_9HEMI